MCTALTLSLICFSFCLHCESTNSFLGNFMSALLPHGPPRVVSLCSLRQTLSCGYGLLGRRFVSGGRAPQDAELRTNANGPPGRRITQVRVIYRTRGAPVFGHCTFARLDAFHGKLFLRILSFSLVLCVRLVVAPACSCGEGPCLFTPRLICLGVPLPQVNAALCTFCPGLLFVVRLGSAVFLRDF